MMGRINATADWQPVHQGDLPWNSGTGRNAENMTISSTYGSGDDSLTYTEVRYHGHSDAYLEYNITFVTRTSGANNLRW